MCDAIYTQKTYLEALAVIVSILSDLVQSRVIWYNLAIPYFVTSDRTEAQELARSYS